MRVLAFRNRLIRNFLKGDTMIRFSELPENEEVAINEKYYKKDKTDYFKVSPRIVPAGEETTITIESEYLYLSGTYLYMLVPYFNFDFQPFADYRDEIRSVEAKDGKLEIRCNFETEQLYRIIVGERTKDDFGQLVKTTVYALDPDMYACKPLAGDFHSHTIHSDGFDTPELVLIAAMKHGLDFIAITDHNSFQGAIAAAEIVEKKHYPITVINGEEYSTSFTNMHILSLGAQRALPSEEYTFYHEGEEVRTTVEYTIDFCRKIHENGGVAVMCHPLWKPFRLDGSRLDVPLSLVKELMEKQVFDAIEIVGGSPIDDHTTSQMTFTYAAGFGALPGSTAYLGTTDSHNYTIDPICGKHFTLVFATDNSQTAIVDAVRQKRTVAVDTDNNLLFGEPRYCMFARFYL